MQIENKNEIKVSVLCLAYNHEKYIRKTLDGFVNQKTNFKFEVLIHDDASTDQTASIIKEYEKQYPDLIKPIYQTENQYSKGVKIQSTFNYPRAQGKYLAYCEGDDYWCDVEKLQRQYDAMEAHPECSLCVHKVQCVNEDGSINSFSFPDKRYGFTYEGVLSDDDAAKAIWQKVIRYPFQLSSYFVKYESVRKLRNSTLPFLNYLCGDENLVRTAFSEGHIFYINRTMSCYRLFSTESYTSRHKKLAVDEKYNILLERAEGELLYDKYTSGRFHKWIIYAVSNNVIRCGAFNKKIMDIFLEEHDLQKTEILSHCSVKNKLKYYLSKYAHPIYSILIRISS